jgi:murein DD-endopeptidase MepM/ murein hydrolase activator NlpD
VTTAFGTRRSYEHHPGTDLAAPLGSPVVAPAAGAVVFVGSLPARGNAVVLDHGAGVFTTYAHLQRAEVLVGDEVRGGEVIGRVGSTGFSTGPHLHWELWVDGANVDPLEWTRRTFP